MSFVVAASFSGSSQNASRAFVKEFGCGEAISLSSLSTRVSLSSLSHTNYIRLFQQFLFSYLHLCEIGVFIEGEEEVGIPQMVEGRPYPLGGCPKKWKQEAKGRCSTLFSRTTQADSPMKQLAWKFFLYI